MLTLKNRILACALATSVFALSGAVHAAACVSAEFVGQNTLNGSCYGTSADSTVRFMPTDPAAQFSTSGSYTGTGTFTTPIIVQPGSSIFASATAFGSLSSRASITGVAPGGNATAATSSDLREGTLKLYGSVDSDDPRFAIANGFNATAKLSDTLSIFIPKVLLDPTIIFYMDIDGVISGSNSSGAGSGTVQAQLLISSLDGSITYPGTNDFQVINGLGSYDQAISRTIDSLQGAEDVGDSWLLSVQLDAQLFALGDPNYSFDFSNTAQLRFELSDGITFTSGSGVLLAGPENNVPEPPTTFLVLLAVGFILAGASSRRRGVKQWALGVTVGRR